VKFTPAGGTVTIDVERSERAVDVRVRDTGRGIDADFLPHVFERFRQADGTVTRTVGGLGLGLFIAQRLVDAHGGNIRVDSDGQDRGATFTVSLPLSEGRLAMLRAASGEATVVASEPSAAPDATIPQRAAFGDLLWFPQCPSNGDADRAHAGRLREGPGPFSRYAVGVSTSNAARGTLAEDRFLESAAGGVRVRHERQLEIAGPQRDHHQHGTGRQESRASSRIRRPRIELQRLVLIVDHVLVTILMNPLLLQHPTRPPVATRKHERGAIRVVPGSFVRRVPAPASSTEPTPVGCGGSPTRAPQILGCQGW
jgi:hypothetical protein